MVCMQDKSQGIGRTSGDAVALPECKVIHWRHLITPPSRCTALGRIMLELVGLFRKALTQDATRRLHAPGWLLSMMVHGSKFVVADGDNPI